MQGLYKDQGDVPEARSGGIREGNEEVLCA